MIDKITLHHIPAQKLGFHALRILFGVSFFLHGAVRLPKLQAFASGMSEKFEPTIVPGQMALAIGYLIPFGEAAAGLLLLIGFKFLRLGCIVGFLVMFTLLAGVGILEHHSAVPSQLIHTLIFVILLVWDSKLRTDSL